jgi:HK97 family phage major capsid protein
MNRIADVPVMKRLGMSKSECERYSLVRALSAAASGSWKSAGLELEVSTELYRGLSRSPTNFGTFLVPTEVLGNGMPAPLQRDMTAAGVSGSNYLVGTENVGFIELMRARSVVFAMGAQVYSGLQGNVTIPKETAGTTAYWLADETTQITESQPTLGQLALTPKSVAALTEVSRQLLLQSAPLAELVIKRALLKDLGLAVDRAAIAGTGTAGQPTGLLNHGIGSVTGTSLGYAGALEFQTDVAANNAMDGGGRFGYVTTPAVAGLLMARQRFSGTDSPVWEGNLQSGKVIGFPALATNQVPAATMLFGDWAGVIIGEWGAVELMVNPFSDFSRGILGVRCVYSLDVGIQNPGSFSAATSIT